jgi:hypothetical protein
MRADPVVLVLQSLHDALHHHVADGLASDVYFLAFANAA